jgi:2-oxo-4-hydroxy-4-carboxy-5-ureidoimidazoline decarboxylase
MAKSSLDASECDPIMNHDDKTLQCFQAMDHASAVNQMLRCCGAKKWCVAIANARPFSSRASLHHAADIAFNSLSESDWLEAFSHHPKIGDIDSLRMKFAGNREWSAGEQADIVNVDEATIVALSEGNIAYEKKFGFIFIVCATGKSAGEMLAMLQQRLLNDGQTELKIAAAEQQAITHLRIDKWELE